MAVPKHKMIAPDYRMVVPHIRSNDCIPYTPSVVPGKPIIGRLIPCWEIFEIEENFGLTYDDLCNLSDDELRDIQIEIIEMREKAENGEIPSKTVRKTGLEVQSLSH